MVVVLRRCTDGEWDLSTAQPGEDGKSTGKHCQCRRLGIRNRIRGIKLYGINAATSPTDRVVGAGEVVLGHIHLVEHRKTVIPKIPNAYRGGRAIEGDCTLILRRRRTVVPAKSPSRTSHVRSQNQIKTESVKTSSQDRPRCTDPRDYPSAWIGLIHDHG